MQTASDSLICVFEEVQRLGDGIVTRLDDRDGDVANISMRELHEVRSLKTPPVVVRRTLEVVYLILNCERTQTPFAPPQWPRVQRMLEQNFIERMLKFDIALLREVPQLSHFLVTEYFGAPQLQGVSERLSFSRVRRANSAAAALFRWCSRQVHSALNLLEQVEEGEGEEQEFEQEQEPEQEFPNLTDELNAEEDAQLKAEAEAEAARLKQVEEEEARRKAEREEARLRSIAFSMQRDEAKRRAEEDARLKTEEEEARRKAEAESRQLEKEADAKLRIEKRNEEWQVFEVLTDFGWEEDRVISRRVCEGGGLSRFEYSARGFDYTVDLKSMRQINKRTGKMRSIRIRAD